MIDEKGELWIAKFLGKGDERDSDAWEILVAELARATGIEMSEIDHIEGAFERR